MEEEIKTYRKFECPFYEERRKCCIHKRGILRILKQKKIPCNYNDIRKCSFYQKWLKK